MTPSARKVIGHQPRKRRTKLYGSIKMEIWLNPIIFLLLIQVSLRFRSPRKISLMEIVEEAIQPMGSTLSKWQKRTKTRTRSKTSAILSAIPISRKATMPTNILKSQKN